MSTRRTRRPIWIASSAACVLGACAGPDPAARPRPPVPPVVEVGLSEYRFELPSSLPTGRVVFHLTNRGMENHRPALLPLPDDFPPVQEEVRNTTSRPVLPFAGVASRPPGSTGTFAADLIPGRRYALVCFITAPDGEGHANKGMTWEARAGGGSATPSTASTTASTSTSTTGG